MAGDDLYRDPSLYDLEYALQDDDVSFYLDRARGEPGPILELGCGNGRITLPLARAGHHVVGIDLAETMLVDLRRKLGAESTAVRDRVQVQRGDFRSLKEGSRYPLVYLPFNALHHCRDHRDVLALLAGVRRALVPGGRFVLDCYLPDPTLYARDPDVRYEPRDFIDPRTGGRLTSWETGRYDALKQIHHVVYIYRDNDGDEHQVRLDLRMFYPQELRALLDWGGFRIVRQAEDFEGNPVHGASLKWVLELEPVP